MYRLPCSKEYIISYLFTLLEREEISFKLRPRIFSYKYGTPRGKTDKLEEPVNRELDITKS